MGPCLHSTAVKPMNRDDAFHVRFELTRVRMLDTYSTDELDDFSELLRSSCPKTRSPAVFALIIA